MSLYREPGRRGRWGVVLAVAAAVVLAAAGFGVGRATAPDPSLGSQLAALRSDAEPAADALELVSIHYESSNEATRAAAREQLARAESAFADVEDRLALVDPEGTRAARRAIDELAGLVESGAPRAEVERAAAAAEQAVRAVGR